MKKLLPSIVLAAFLIAALLGSVAAAPGAAPSPAPLADRIVSVNSSSVATDTTFRSISWAGYDEADVFYRILDGAEVNTMTLELEVSPDGLNWYDHNIVPNVASAVATTTNAYTAGIAVNGTYFRLIANVSNTQTVTPNIKVVLR